MSKKKDLRRQRDEAYALQRGHVHALEKVRSAHSAQDWATPLDDSWMHCQAAESKVHYLSEALSNLVEAIEDRKVSMGRGKNGHRVNIGAITEELGNARIALGQTTTT